MSLLQLLLLMVLAGCGLGSGCAAQHAPTARSDTGLAQLPQLLPSASSHAQRLRRLLQQQQKQQAKASKLIDVPQCIWNDVREVCTSSQLAYLSVSSPPVTVFHKTAVTAYDRNLVCSGHPDATRCNKDRQNRCMYWNKSCVGMDAYELVNWIGGGILDGQAAALAFTCAGTDAATYKACGTASDAGADGICNQLPGCQFAKLLQGCVPKAWDALSFGKVQYIKDGFDQLSLQVWGTCAGACYVRQANSCLRSDGNATTCLRKAYCTWELDVLEGRRVCIHRDTASRGSDAFSKEFAKIRDTCTRQQSQEACEKLRVMPKNTGMYRNTNLIKIMQEAAPGCPL